MSDLHILDGTGNTVRVACHVPIPSGANAAGVPKQEAWRNSGRAVASVLSVGTGAGQITQAEADQLLAGTLAEVVLDAHPEAQGTPADRLTMYRELWDQARDTVRDQLQALRWFGATFSKGGGA